MLRRCQTLTGTHYKTTNQINTVLPMATFYDLLKPERIKLVSKISNDISTGLNTDRLKKIMVHFGNTDTYIRKSAYISVGRIYVDKHHSPRNAVIGSIKKMGEVNPEPVLHWAKKYLHHADKEIRREICHGIELRGRKYPQDILPLLKELQHDKTARVRNTLVHVLGQIAYKKGCLEIVTAHLKNWENKQLVADAFIEIIDVHRRYRNFSALMQDQACQYIENNQG